MRLSSNYLHIRPSCPGQASGQPRLPGSRVGACLLLGLVVLAGCAPMRQGQAPVESRTIGKAIPPVPRSTPPGQPTPTPAKPAVSATPSVVPPAPGVASLPPGPAPEGFYRVRRGDTLIGISLDHGVAWRDLAAWNQLENPNLIEVDQLLRIRPPVSVSPSTASSSIAPASTVATAPSVIPAPAAASSPRTQAIEKPVERPADRGTDRPPARAGATDGFSLSWPSRGPVIANFAEPGYKGIAISGSEGDPVTAASDGRVVYSGNGLRGYGNLVIVKHDGDFLTAYAHNKTILVSEGQAVKRGQKIAELGKTDSDVPKLHFEVRRSGKPVDPMKYLAQR
jgi:lipoprotein NlpD